jgi:hypothetical protein
VLLLGAGVLEGVVPGVVVVAGVLEGVAGVLEGVAVVVEDVLSGIVIAVVVVHAVKRPIKAIRMNVLTNDTR